MCLFDTELSPEEVRDLLNNIKEEDDMADDLKRMYLISNKFIWAMSFRMNVEDYIQKKINLREFAEQLCMLGVGHVLDGNNQYVIPTDRDDLLLNSAVHNLLRTKGLLDELRGFFYVDSELVEEHTLKVASSGYDKKLLEFLQDEPDKALLGLEG